MVFPVVLIGDGPEGCCLGRVYCAVGVAGATPAAQYTRPTQRPSGPPPINTTGNTIRCYSRSNTPDDGRKPPKHAELKEHQ
jgi:hypothetical protein